jgi:hypothetical protein
MSWETILAGATSDVTDCLQRIYAREAAVIADQGVGAERHPNGFPGNAYHVSWLSGLDVGMLKKK